jgi:hypothetical protein
MAKLSNVGPRRDVTEPPPIVTEASHIKAANVSARTRRAIDALAEPFNAFVGDFAALGQKRADLAPKFMKTLGQWQAETGGTFVDFVRELVPDLPTKRDEYRSHAAYAAADYLRRLSALSRAGVGSAVVASMSMQTPVTPVRAVAKVIAAVLPLIAEESVGLLWDALKESLHWSDRQMAQLQTLTAEASPVARLAAPRGVKVEHTLKIERTSAQPAA